MRLKMNGSPVIGPEDFSEINKQASKDLNEVLDKVLSSLLEDQTRPLDEQLKKQLDEKLKQYEEETEFKVENSKIFRFSWFCSRSWYIMNTSGRKKPAESRRSTQNERPGYRDHHQRA